MTQYINLYRGGQRAAGPRNSVLALAAVAVAVVAMAGYGTWVRLQAAQLEERVKVLETANQTTQVNLAALAKQQAERQPDGALSAEIAAAESRRRLQQDVFAALESGALGNMEGYACYLRALAHRSGDGVWLTGFSVTRGGAAMAIQGRAVDAERIPGYLRKLRAEIEFQDRRFADLRVDQPRAEHQPETKAGGRFQPVKYVEFVLSSERGDKREGAR